VAAFYHDNFVRDQVRDFRRLVDSKAASVTDVGGGCGYFARGLQEATGCSVRVIDADPESVRACKQAGIEAEIGDALVPRIGERQDVVSFNLILHHLVAGSAGETRLLQRKALENWRGSAGLLFVNEYIYDSWLGDLSGWLIYQVTRNPVLSAVGKWGARYFPSLAANTFGVGVRFRSQESWVSLFRDAGYTVCGTVAGEREAISPLWRLLLIRRISRDSFLLESR
jgi:hypothetical protein